MFPTPGTDGALPGAPAACSAGCGCGCAGATEPCPVPLAASRYRVGTAGAPPSPRFPSAALTGTRRRPRRGSGAPRYTGQERGTDGAGRWDAGRHRGDARCPGGGAPVQPERARPPRPAPGPALPGRCRAGAAAERDGGRRRRLRGGQGRRCLRPGALRAAAAGADADRQRGLRPDRVLLPGRGWLHEHRRGPPALLHLQPQRGRLSLRHRHRRPRLPRLHLLLRGGRLFPPDQQHYRPQVPGPGRPRLLRCLDLPVVHRFLFLDQPMVLDAARVRVHRSRLRPCCHHLQLLLHLLLGAPAHLRLQEVQNGGGGLCSKLYRPQPGGSDSLLQLSQHQPRELPAAALHTNSGGPRGVSATPSVLSPGWHPRHSCASAVPYAGWEGGICNFEGTGEGDGCFV